jgi:hypothetical protein
MSIISQHLTQPYKTLNFLQIITIMFTLKGMYALYFGVQRVYQLVTIDFRQESPRIYPWG